MLISGNFHSKSNEVSIKTRSTPASLSFKGWATKHNCKIFYSLSFDVFKVGFPALASFEGSSSLLVAFSSLRVGLGFFGSVTLWLEYQGSDQKVGV